MSRGRGEIFRKYGVDTRTLPQLFDTWIGLRTPSGD